MQRSLHKWRTEIVNSQWLRFIRFKLPIIENDLSIGLDNGTHVKCVVLMSKVKEQNNEKV